MTNTMLTTLDNPFSPFDQYEDWLRYDTDQGYFTNEYLARIAFVTDELTDEMVDREIDRAIDEIVSYNLLGLYKKVTKDDYEGGKWKPYVLKDDEKPTVVPKNRTQSEETRPNED